MNDFGEGSILLVPHGEPTPILVPEVMERVRELNAQRMGLRITAPSAAFRDALLAAGFRDLGDRIEFKTEVEALPDDEGTPLAWRNAGASLTPSPVIATTWCLAWSASTRRNFCSGATRANTATRSATP